MSLIDLCLDACSPAEICFLLSLAWGQLDMMGIKIRAGEEWERKNNPTANPCLTKEPSLLAKAPKKVLLTRLQVPCLESEFSRLSEVGKLVLSFIQSPLTLMGI